MELPNSFLHTNFRISSNYETLVLSDENEKFWILFYKYIRNRYVFGKNIRRSKLEYFFIPSPWESNDNPAFTGALNDLEFSESGFFNVTPIFSINSPDDSATIYYTTDGTEPNQLSAIYEEPILLFLPL